MDEEEDDLYGGTNVKSEAYAAASGQQQYTNGDAHMKQEDAEQEQEDEEEDDDDEDEDEDDSGSDIDIITERKDGPPPEPVQSQPFKRIKIEQPRTTSTDAVPTQRSSGQSALKSEAPAPNRKVSLRDGSKYPEVRTSTIDLDGTPVWEPAGKPITELDLDADMAMEKKPWREPGTDPTDFFNYGFDEFSWVQYCIKQGSMRDAIAGQKAETEQFKMYLGAPAVPGPAPGPPPAMPGMPPMPGMPDMNPDMVNAMMGAMQQQGISDPSQLDMNTMMQMMQQFGMPGMPGMPGPPAGPGGQFGQGQQQQGQQGQGFGGGFGGQNMQHQGSGQGFGQQHGQSPYPGQQQGQSYGGTTPQPQQQGQQADLSGYSAQQIAMMQGQGGGGQGGGGRGRGRGRRW